MAIPAASISDHNARLASARKLTEARFRRASGHFLVEGAHGLEAALARAGTVVEVFATADAIDRYRDLIDGFVHAGHPISEVTSSAIRALSGTVTPPGLVAVCRRIDVGLEAALEARSMLVAVLAGTNDPGNAGTIVRTADAAGADAVVLTRPAVDVYNGKSVRATAGSLFHLAVVVDAGMDAVLDRAGELGLQILAATGSAPTDLDRLHADGRLARPTVWLFGHEAHGLDRATLARADERVRVPIYGSAESLNLGAAAAVCLYASARAQRAVAGHPR